MQPIFQPVWQHSCFLTVANKYKDQDHIGFISWSPTQQVAVQQ